VVAVSWKKGPLGGLRLTTLGTQVLCGVLGFLPWALVLPLAVVAAVRMRRVRPVAFALCWFLVQTALVFAAQQQRLRYLLPLLPGAALLVAWWADREASGARPRRALAVVTFGVSLLGAIVTPFALDRVDMALRVSVWEIAVVLLGIVTIGMVAAAALWIGRLAVAVPAVVSASAVVLLSGGWIVDDWENRAWDYRSAAVDLRKIAAPLAVAALVDDHELLQVDFYLGRALPPLRSAEAVRAHLTARHGAVVVETARWRAAPQWLPLERGHLHADALGADVLVVTDGVP